MILRVQMGTSTLLRTLVLLMLIALYGCSSGGRVAGLDASGTVLQDFTLTTLNEGVIGTAGMSSLNLRLDGSETVVEVAVNAAGGLKAYCFELAYDQERYTPVSAAATGLLDGFTDEDVSAGTATLEASDLSLAGIAAHGQVLIRPDEKSGFTGTGVIAEIRFRPGPFTGGRTASSPPSNEIDRPVLALDEAASRLSWDYGCLGDYNQNGLVTVSDLTLLGVYFNAAGPFAPGSIESVVDGNSDGLITVSDITPLGRNYEQGIGSYRVFFTSQATQRPEAGGDAGLEPLVEIPFSAANGDPAGERLCFTVNQPMPAPNGWIWL